MRDWNLVPGDPLFLTLAADFRLSVPDVNNDHIWELEPSGGDPPAISLRTTYGLRARSMRIFPRFLVRGQTLSDPAVFSSPVCLRRFSPNSLYIDFSILPRLDVSAGFWVPESHVAAGHLTITNHCQEPITVLVEMCGQLVPLEGQSLAAIAMHSSHVLAGRAGDLAPVIFLTGGAQPGAGPYPALALDLALAGGGARSFTWVQAALPDQEESFELARQVAGRPWEAEQARIELLNASQTIDVRTGDPDWDAAFALSQKAALGLFLGAGGAFPCPSFVQGREPDHGCSVSGSGLDLATPWNGGSPLEATYLASILPGAPQLAAGMLKNFLAVQLQDGSIDLRPGLAGQRSRWLATPLLAVMIWDHYCLTGDVALLKVVFPHLLAFHRQWFTPQHDRDQDGLPEWDDPAQTELDEFPLNNPHFDADASGAMLAVESPALGALLYRQGTLLAEIAALLGESTLLNELDAGCLGLKAAVEACWQEKQSLYHYRDRDTHASPKGRQITRQSGDGRRELTTALGAPTRLLLQINSRGRYRSGLMVILTGRRDQQTQTVRLDADAFTWGLRMAVSTCQDLFTDLASLEVRGLGGNDSLTLWMQDYSMEDISLFLPLWAGIPGEERARALIHQTLLASDRFWRPFGIPLRVEDGQRGRQAQRAELPVSMPWNLLIGEALLKAGMRTQAAVLTTRLMSAVVGQLKREHTFRRAYDAETGAGLGERNALHGLAPLGLFLKVLGVEIRSPLCVSLSGMNPFPWPVTVQYRGLTVARQTEETRVTFPDGRSLSLTDPTDAVVSMDQ